MKLRSAPSRHRALRCVLAAALLCLGGAAHGQACIFTSGSGAINFPALDPAVASTITAFTDVRTFCLPINFTPAWQFSGANGTAPLRMKHVTQSSFIAYSIAANFTGNVGLTQNWRLTATILGANYQNAFVGPYSDILVATITP